ncbi:hypothetical protein BJ508DRAFT_415861 [Ascobolus immersus RN42]|uniref:Thioredoxin domain-containing protein n=1 Tax=Ascobolus immersus RN42 TaxID=1160509 RepID=A0A3N4I2H2_ASCIM|nr:hypothetical protein BJ508DRAFT_415861 [Ascobolus immersus RN42]
MARENGLPQCLTVLSCTASPHNTALYQPNSQFPTEPSGHFYHFWSKICRYPSTLHNFPIAQVPTFVLDDRRPRLG